MSATNCTTCKWLVKSGGYRGRMAERSCVKNVFPPYMRAIDFRPIENCPKWKDKSRKEDNHDHHHLDGLDF